MNVRYGIKPTRASPAITFDGCVPMGIGACRVVMIRLVVIVVASLLGRVAGAQSQPHHPAVTTSVGTWRGTSTCLVRSSSCNDEIVVYRIAHMNAPDSVTLDARKIVRGEEEEMGVLACRFASPNGLFTCVMPLGTWQFRVHDDCLVGELRLTNNTKFRDVRTVRAPSVWRGKHTAIVVEFLRASRQDDGLAATRFLSEPMATIQKEIVIDAAPSCRRR